MYFRKFTALKQTLYSYYKAEKGMPKSVFIVLLAAYFFAVPVLTLIGLGIAIRVEKVDGLDQAIANNNFSEFQKFWEFHKEEIIATRNPFRSRLVYRSPLCPAIQKGKKAIVELLLKEGFDPNQPARFLGDVCFPVFAAAVNGHLDILQLLVEKGGRLDTYNQEGTTILNVAAGTGQLDIVDYLLMQGISIETEDVNHHTALETAILRGYPNIVKYLLKRGASLVHKDRHGNTPLQLATQANRPDLVDILKRDNK